MSRAQNTNDGFELRESPEKGEGIFATEPFEVGDTVMVGVIEEDCGIRVNETGAHDFIAMKDISVNEEITFDYAMRNYAIDHFQQQCMCGSARCSGRITGWQDLPDEKKKEYEGFVAPYLLELDARHSRYNG